MALKPVTGYIIKDENARVKWNCDSNIYCLIFDQKSLSA